MFLSKISFDLEEEKKQVFEQKVKRASVAIYHKVPRSCTSYQQQKLRINITNKGQHPRTQKIDRIDKLTKKYKLRIKWRTRKCTCILKPNLRFLSKSVDEDKEQKAFQIATQIKMKGPKHCKSQPR